MASLPALGVTASTFTGLKYEVVANGRAVLNVTFKGQARPTTGWVYGEDGPISPLYDVDYSALKLSRYSEEFSDCKWIITKGYDGPDIFGNSNDMAAQSMEITLSTEPIQSHVNFAGIATQGGTPTLIVDDDGQQAYLFPDTGATFTVKGMFQYFRTYLGDLNYALSASYASGNVNPLGGILSYLMPGQTVSDKRFVEDLTGIDFTQVGKIIDPSSLVTWLPTPETGRNYLYAGIRIDRIPFVGFDIDRKFTLSGWRGWNSTIYGF